jgi:trk system potassium uptake protein TrkA
MHVIIVGGGNTGSYLANILLENKHTVRVIESRPSMLEVIRAELPEGVVISGDGSSPTILEEAGIKQAQVVAAVTGDDETNLVISSLARFEYNVPRVIGRVNNPKNAWLYNKDMGVDVPLNQADVLAHMVAEEMSLGDMMTLLKLSRGEYSLIEEKVHPKATAIGRPIHELNLPKECTIVSIIRKEQLIIPRGDTVIQGGDEILAMVHKSRLRQFEETFSPHEAGTQQ